MRISRVVPHFNFDSLDARYQVFRLRCTGEKFGYYDPVIDALSYTPGVLSVVFLDKTEAWVMIDRNTDNVGSGSNLLRSAIGNRRDLAFNAIRTLRAVNERVLINLFLAALPNDPIMENASNTCGKLLVVSLGIPNTEYFEDTGLPSVVHALSIGVNPRMVLELKVETFTSCAAREFKEYLARYELVDGRYLRRAFHIENPGDSRLFCKGVIRKGARYGGFSFLDASNTDSFMKSKLGILQSTLLCLDDMFEGDVGIDFLETTDLERIDCGVQKIDVRLSAISTLLSTSRIVISDGDGELTFKVDKVADKVEELIDVRPEISNDIDLNALNLRIVRPQRWYETKNKQLEKTSPGAAGIVDPYKKLGERGVVQHITTETSVSSNVVMVALKELCIKRDILERRMTLFNWDFGRWCFAVRQPDNKDEMAFLTIDNDGSLTLEGPMPSFQGFMHHEGIVDLLTMHEDSEFAVESPDGNLNCIYITELYGMPNFEQIRHDLEFRRSGRENWKAAIGRGAEDKELYFYDAVDIASCKDDERHYYRVGLIGKGMSFSATSKASILRECIPADGSRSLASDLLPMMDVYMIRWGQPTVVPFPIKYLREWVAMKSPTLSETT